MTCVKRAHPIAMIESMGRLLFLLVIPFFRGLLTVGTSEGLAIWLKGVWIDFLVLVGILFLGYVRWLFRRHQISEDGIWLDRGLFFRRVVRIPKEAILSLRMEESWYLRPFRAVRVRLEPERGRSRSDLRMIVSRKEGEALVALFSRGKGPADWSYRPRWFQVGGLSLFFSNTLAGVIFFSTVLKRVGEILGEELRWVILSTVEEAAKVLFFIPRTTAILSLILLLGWLAAFGRNLLRYRGFRAERRGDILKMEGGLVTRQTLFCRRDRIIYADLRQSVLTWLLGVYTVGIRTAGREFGGEKGKQLVLIPAGKGEAGKRELEGLLPGFHQQKNQLTGGQGTLFRFCAPVLGVVALIPVVGVWAYRTFPHWGELIGFLTVAGLMPALWMIAVRVADRYRGGIGVKKNCVTLRYARGFTLHTVVIPADRIGRAVIRTSLFQRRRGLCDLQISTVGMQDRVHPVRNVKEGVARELLGLVELSYSE
ncbi:MAG: hypothetical protein E7486_05115 [Ruminococcaceae bacterium]|nr:hypothetical protein [Oscillospiraceae bacterium]